MPYQLNEFYAAAADDTLKERKQTTAPCFSFPPPYGTTVVIIGMGELGTLFASGFLKLGFLVAPVTRRVDLAAVDDTIKQPFLCLIATDIGDLGPVFDWLPESWKDRLVLLQNELLPSHWEGRHIKQQPSVVTVWLEKKKDSVVKKRDGLPEVVFSPIPAIGEALCAALLALDIPCKRVDSFDLMLHCMVMKNLFNCTMNVGGLLLDGDGERKATFSQLLADEKAIARVLADAATIQEVALGVEKATIVKPRELLPSVKECMSRMPTQICQGRFSKLRTKRAYEARADHEVPTLKELYEKFDLANFGK